MYAKFFNVMGFPACHVPMGLNSEGLPIGFQVNTIFISFNFLNEFCFWCFSPLIGAYLKKYNKEVKCQFQVVAAPHQDRLCLAMAVELEHAFGGWVPPS